MVELINLRSVSALCGVPSKPHQYRASPKKAPHGAFLFFCLSYLTCLSYLIFLSLFASSVARASCALSSLPDLPNPKALESVQIESIYDGDTLMLADGRSVRLIGINTPELSGRLPQDEPLAIAARDLLMALLPARQGWLLVGAQGQDHYGRVLGHVWNSAGDNLIQQLLTAGLGFQVAIPPNLGFFECYQQAEDQARTQLLGVWGHPYYAPKETQRDQLRAGYGRIRGRVDRVRLTKNAILIELRGDLSLKVERQYASFIKEAMVDEWVRFGLFAAGSAQWLDARGWLSDRLQWPGGMPQLVMAGKRKRYQLKLFHASQLEQHPSALE